MKNLVLLTAIVFLLFTECRKTNLISSKLRLTKISEKSSDGNTYNQLFDYDTAGRLIRYSKSINNESLRTVASVTYNNNEVILQFAPSEGLPNEQNIVRYIVDPTNKVLKRVSFHYTEYFPAQGPQKEIEYDSTTNDYDPNGLLYHANGLLKDSLSFYPMVGVMQIRSVSIVYNGVWQNAGNNLVSVNRSFSIDSLVSESGITNHLKRTATENISFDYSKKYAVNIDTKNSFLFKELNIFPFALYDMNMIYKNFPNGTSIQQVVKDENGTVIFSQNSSEETVLTFNSSGFILTKSPDTQSSKQYFFYSSY